MSPVEEIQVQRPAGTSFRADIEGLRAVAVLAVVLFHAEVPGITGGYIGVDVFFVISGFLITRMLWREVSADGSVRLRRFYGARARRLLPASAAVGVFTAIGSALLLPPLQAQNVFADGIASALYVGNYWFALQLQNYFDASLPPSPFEHYWSLGVEEQFYLVWPPLIICTVWLIRLARRRTKTHVAATGRPYFAVLTIVAIVSFAASLALTYLVPSVAFFSLPTRAWELAIGGLVALTATQWRRLPAVPAALVGWGGLAAIVLGCVRLTPTTPFPGTAALLPVLGAAMVIGAGCAGSSRGCGRLLATQPMQAIGRLSYSWYLWHWPVLVLAPALFGHPLGLAGRLTAALVSGLLAVVTLRLIENPLRFATRLRQSPIRSLALGGGVTAVAVCVCVVLMLLNSDPVGRGAPATSLTVSARPAVGRGIDAYQTAVQDAFNQVQDAVSASLDHRAVPSNLTPSLSAAASEKEALFNGACMRNLFDAVQPECASGDTSSPTTVALVGDSNGAMWAPAIQEVAKNRRWRMEALTKADCPPMELPIDNPMRRVLYAACQQWRSQIIAQLRSMRPRLVVVSMWRGYGGADVGWTPGFTPYDDTWLDSLSRLVQQLRETGAAVLVLGPVPALHSVVPVCLSAHLDDATACSASRSSAVNESGIDVESAATNAAGARYVDVSRLFCSDIECPAIVGNTLVYFDRNHLTVEYARALAPVMGALADEALAGR